MTTSDLKLRMDGLSMLRIPLFELGFGYINVNLEFGFEALRFSK